MSRRYRLPALVLLVTGLLAVVAIAAHGRPLGAATGKASGLPSSFWDYVLTSTFILVAIAWLVVLFTALYLRPDPRKKPVPPRVRMIRTLAIMMVVAVLLTLLGRYLHLHHLHANQAPKVIAQGQVKKPHPGQQPAAPNVRFRWNEAAIVLGLVLAAGGVFLATRRRAEPRRLELRTRPEALATALDESLDDLRSDPDLRRAIIAAYARMEAVLAAEGLPRHPAEAPLEYLERALLALDTSGAAVRRLTDLFEWARFSHHEPEPAMRDEAVDALQAVRDELRAPEPVAVA